MGIRETVRKHRLYFGKNNPKKTKGRLCSVSVLPILRLRQGSLIVYLSGNHPVPVFKTSTSHQLILKNFSRIIQLLLTPYHYGQRKQNLGLYFSYQYNPRPQNTHLFGQINRINFKDVLCSNRRYDCHASRLDPTQCFFQRQSR